MASKLVVLKLGKGNFEQGFPVTLQIGKETAPPSDEITGDLPPSLEVPESYRRWQSTYRRMDFAGRPIGLPKEPRSPATVAECEVVAQELRDRFNQWLEANSFRRIREKWLEQLKTSETIRVVVQTDDPQVRRLPWHVWDLLERYPQAEIALSPLDFGSRPKRLASTTSQVRILAILGNSKGIDIQKDQAVLKQVGDARVTFLVEPARQDVSDQLWDQSWEILFFAGHSISQNADETGLIYLNQTETLSMSQLKHALEKAVDRGLKLAIFNSCDGLGLARELAYLQIPQLIVMREPVPDRVAEEFLKYFLSAYARGESLYLAVREARSRLQGLENQFPCASWLPVICQHPTEMPPTWLELRQQKPPEPTLTVPTAQAKFRRVRPQLASVAAISVALTGILTGIRFTGALQPLELRAFDHLLQLRPKEPQDPRLLVIEVTEKDIQDQRQQDPTKPLDISLSNRFLERLLKVLEPLQPRVIGLDIYRDYPAGNEVPTLVDQFKTNDRLVPVCKIGDLKAREFGIKPPPEFPIQHALDRLGFSNFADEPDAVRRHLLAVNPDAVCPADYALNMQLAIHYLAKQGILLETTPAGEWKWGKTLIQPIEFPFGGYVKIDARGHQILLNYRSPENASSFHTPEDVVPRISLEGALSGKLTVDLVRDKIVLIGTTARIQPFNDYFPTPYRDEQGQLREIPGVILHAQMTSQLISAVLDGRSLLWALPIWAEVFWVLGWSLVGGLLAVCLHRFVVLCLFSAAAIVTLYGICLVLLIQLGCWISLVPPAIACLSSTSLTLLSSLRLTQSHPSSSQE